MSSLVMPFVLCFTVIASVGFGVITTYAAVIGILHAFANASRPATARPQLVLVPTQTHASGD